ncbi:MAG: gamma-glutamyltransferase [Synergistaceae bacterium]|nr:gamma-glutamyltransferase [Synergistaceae bacterium]
MKKVFLAAVMVLAMVSCAFCEIEDVYAGKGMVSSAHELASRAGVEILQKGGNAVDAAIATYLALNVVEFNASGIGGGGFMVIRSAKTGEVIELDYREMAPSSATKDMYSTEYSKKAHESFEGGKSIGVPGAVMGMFTALEKYGTMKFADVAAPAIKLAEEGFTLAPMQNGIITDEYDKLTRYNRECAFIVDGLPLEAGATLKQPELAKTFRLLAEKGPSAFYGGEIGQAVVEAVNATGGKMSIDDLRAYKMEERVPVKGTYRGYTIYSTPPASSGGTHIVQLLNIMENFDVKALGHNTAKYLHTLSEAMKQAFADRQKYMADTAFAPDVPLSGLTSKAYAKTIAEKISPEKSANEVLPGNPGEFVSYNAGDVQERISTSSFSVVDAEGNIVASTNTVNYFMGSGVIVPGYGFVLNDEMDDFAQNPDSVNAPEPGKRPLSSMSPTIVIDPEGKPFMTLGAAGAMRIITAVTQIIINVVDFGMTMDEAIEQPRIFNSASNGKANKLMIEQGISDEVVKALAEMGHETDVQPFTGYFGTAQGIMFDHANNRMNGGADSRRLGVPVGF